MVAAPVPTPVTTPVVLTEATAALLVAHVPPDAASAKVMVEPIQTTEGPVMVPALAVVLTVMATEAEAVPQAVVEV
jgi:hypothetical protein